MNQTCLLALSVVALFWLAAPVPARGEEAILQLARHVVRAEIARTPPARERGLMGRERLCANCGMLFAFRVAGRYGFWMKDTPLPLSIAFVGQDGTILNIEEMQPDTLAVHYPEGDARYALEMNGGWFVAHGVKRGDRVAGIPALHAE